MKLAEKDNHKLQGGLFENSCSMKWTIYVLIPCALVFAGFNETQYEFTDLWMP